MSNRFKLTVGDRYNDTKYLQLSHKELCELYRYRVKESFGIDIIRIELENNGHRDPDDILEKLLELGYESFEIIETKSGLYGEVFVPEAFLDIAIFFMNKAYGENRN